jgi:hypothetical protein
MRVCSRLVSKVARQFYLEVLIMRVFGLTVVLFGAVANPISAQESCLDPAALIRLDSMWEKALLESDANFLAPLLAEDFIWVHNHASTVDTKELLLERLSHGSGDTRSRISSDVVARILGSTGVVTGFTIVDRGPTPTRYNFMRTYVEVSGRCLLLANHTMAIPEEGG